MGKLIDNVLVGAPRPAAGGVEGQAGAAARSSGEITLLPRPERAVPVTQRRSRLFLFLHPAHAGPWVRGVGFALTYLLLAEIGHLLSFPTSRFATFWPPSGFFLAVLVRNRPSRWPSILAGALAANLASDTLLHDQSAALSLAFWFGNSLEAMAGAWLLRRIHGEGFALRNPREVLGFIGLAALLATTLSATVGAAGATIALKESFAVTWQIWWFADALGVLIVGPLFLSWSRPGLRIRDVPSRRLVELSVAVVLLAVVSFEVFGAGVVTPTLRFTYWVFPFLIWLAARADLRGASLGTLVLAVIAVLSTVAGYGPFADAAESETRQALFLQTYLGVVTLVTLQLAVSQSERDRYQRELAAKKLQLEEANAQLEHLAATDPLTFLRNRRALEQSLHREFAMATRLGVPLSVAMLDLDWFKLYNDVFGHLEGDEVLRAVARLLLANSRQMDLVARYGGEEFVLVLPGTDQEGAVRLAERVREAIEEHSWPLRPVTASLGVATCFPGNGSCTSPDDLLALADSALYRAKQSGRNRTAHVADPG